MTSFSWFSGKSEPSRKFMWMSFELANLVALDPGAFHLSIARRVIHDGVVLGRTVVPERDAVLLPAEAHLVFRDEGLAHEVLQQLARTGDGVLAVAHVARGVEVGEVRGEG